MAWAKETCTREDSRSCRLSDVGVVIAALSNVERRFTCCAKPILGTSSARAREVLVIRLTPEISLLRTGLGIGHLGVYGPYAHVDIRHDWNGSGIKPWDIGRCQPPYVMFDPPPLRSELLQLSPWAS